MLPWGVQPLSRRKKTESESDAFPTKDGAVQPAIVVFGAAGAVGRAVVERFLDSTASTIFALDRRSVVGFTDQRVHTAVVDATSHAEVGAVAASIQAQGYLPEVLVNCQGLFSIQSFDDITADDWRLHQDVNLTSAFFSCQAFGRCMKEARFGAIVNIASGAGERGSPRPASHYAAAKGGLIAFSKSLARELLPHGVRVNVVSPGPLDTEMYGSTEDRQRAATQTPMGRLGDPHEIADVVDYLASPRASLIAGAIVRANGGLLI